jgi:hypothetical protein
MIMDNILGHSKTPVALAFGAVEFALTKIYNLTIKVKPVEAHGFHDS